MAIKEGFTQIPISLVTRKRLKEIGKMSETYDELINRLIDETEGGK